MRRPLPLPVPGAVRFNRKPSDEGLLPIHRGWAQERPYLQG